MSIYLKIQDAVNGRRGSVYFTVDGRRFEVPGIQRIEAFDVISERTMKTVGTVKTQTAVSGVEGQGNITMQYYGVSTFGNMVTDYRKTGVFPSFDIMVINEDPGTDLGRRVISFTNCVLVGNVPLAKLDATIDDALTIDIAFKYGNCTVIDDFREPTAVGRE